MVPPLLRANANFRRYFIGQSISLLGDQVSLIALPLTAVLVLLLLALHVGLGVDRRGRRRQTMLAADLVRALLTASAAA